jgi:serine/threonine protein phosphatase 1
VRGVSAAPLIPEDRMLTYAIGDIHGQLAMLEEAHARIATDRAAHGNPRAKVVHVGDLVDRGPDSRGVIDFLIAGEARGEDWVVLKGNHDRMFRGFLDDADHHDRRLRSDLSCLNDRLGGAETLASYGIGQADSRLLHDLQAEAQAAVPSAHVAFLDRLQPYSLIGAVLFAHAGIRPGIDLHAQTEDDLLWIRREFLEDTRDHGALVVHGHTPVDAVTHYGNRVNIDTGAGYGDALSAIAIEDGNVWVLTAKGRVRVSR